MATIVSYGPHGFALGYHPSPERLRPIGEHDQALLNQGFDGQDQSIGIAAGAMPPQGPFRRIAAIGQTCPGGHKDRPAKVRIREGVRWSHGEGS